MKKIATVFVTIMLVATLLAGCSQAERVSYNISKEADNFNVVRRLVVVNGRTDSVFFEVIGVFSFTLDSERIIITARTGEDEYKKHSVGLPAEAFWSCEDISGADVSSYRYEVNFLPEMIWPIEFTTPEKEFIGDPEEDGVIYWDAVEGE